MPIGKIYLVRHGAYMHPEKLTPTGLAQAEQAGDELLALGIGASALVLSSDAPRALQTAERIAAKLGVEKVFGTQFLGVAGLKPECAPTIEAVIEAALHENGLTPPADGQGLVAVTHQPLLSAVTGDQTYRNGQVTAYEVGSWQNPYYSEEMQEYYLPELAEIRTGGISS